MLYTLLEMRLILRDALALLVLPYLVMRRSNVLIRPGWLQYS